MSFDRQPVLIGDLVIIDPENRRSQRALEKIGGVRAGRTLDAQGHKRVVYEILWHACGRSTLAD